ncbi:NADAR domain-containing protein [Krasilnikovia cinnamomea]|uniref:NADAR domain-containing protein n=1 Tax=Krasilnikovia cinnamomea TaxID=349313 RepID=UPI001F5ED673|nr:NADAR domain-containing protein [Krasilnikovia cinnamomea]
MFPTAEHYMMWRKATLFADAGTARRILAVEDPAAARELGRQVRGFTEQTWPEHPDAGVPGRWRGQNLLGFALMEVRDRLRAA